MGSTSTAFAGSFIIAGTDADDHGFANGSGNQDGWLFMQRALENIAPGVTNGNKTVVAIGTSGGTATNAATSAFNLSSLPGAGWTLSFVDGAANLSTFFTGSGIGAAGILLMDSGDNVGGGADSTERGVFTTNATAINNFLGAGGGLFSQANEYGWVNALVPGLTVTVEQNDGLALTAAGSAAFPGLNNADLSAGPWHNFFGNTGTLPILATSTDPFRPGVPVILGAQGGTVTNPQPTRVPDTGSTLALMLGSMGSLLGGRFLKKRFARA
ncbi:MAG: hypothetical protein H8M99_13880 [Gloeobacteraceae cyanobacterium ES-bin-144]|nr:hypothetical protein [Verrucomicrobiales bacterium]